MNRHASLLCASAVTAALVGLAGCGSDGDSEKPTVATAPNNPDLLAPPIVAVTPSPSSSPTSDSVSADAPGAEDGQTITINLEAGKPTEKVGPNIKVNKGDRLTLVVTSDKDYEVHVHGLNISIKIPAGQTVTKTFVADIAPGSYEVEIEETGVLLFSLQVS